LDGVVLVKTIEAVVVEAVERQGSAVVMYGDPSLSLGSTPLYIGL
jgi:hypothetical protein